MPVSNGSLLDIECTAAELADGWSDDDIGEAVSSAVTDEPVGDSVSTAWKLNSVTSADTNDYAGRTKDVGSIEGLGNRIVVSIKLYCQTIGTAADSDHFQFRIYRSDWTIVLKFCSDGLFVYNSDGGPGYVEVGTNLVLQDTWITWTFDIDLSGGVGSGTFDTYMGDVLQVSGTKCDHTGSWTDGTVGAWQFGFANDNQVSFIDWIKIGDGGTGFPSAFIPRIIMF